MVVGRFGSIVNTLGSPEDPGDYNRAIGNPENKPQDCVLIMPKPGPLNPCNESRRHLVIAHNRRR